MRKSILLLAALAVLMAGTASAAQPAEYLLARYVLAAGGARLSAAGYVLDTTIGQAVTGIVSVGGYQLRSGFWFGTVMERLYLPLVLKAGP